MSDALKWLFGLDEGEFSGQGTWHFRLIAEYSGMVRFLLLLALAAMVYLTIRSYRREGDTSRRAKALIASIRLLVILLIFGVLFRPAAVFRIARTLHSAVVVLVDDSLSMSFTDRYEPDARQQIANTLHVDPEKVEQTSRMDLARKALSRRDGAIAKLAEEHPLIVLRFSTARPGKEPYTRKLLDVSLVGPNGGDDGPSQAEAMAELTGALKRLDADGYETNLAAALRDTIEKVQGLLVKDIVIVSDGQMTSEGAGSRLTSALAYADNRGIRRYAVLVGDPTPPKNLAVAGLQAPREVRRESKVQMSAVLAHRNLDGQSVTVKLFRRRAGQKNETEVASQSVVLTASAELTSGQRSRGLQSVTLHVVPDELGEFIYRAAVEPIAGERNAEDNSAEAGVTVSDKKIKILLVSGDSGWEAQRLRTFLMRAEDLYRVSVWQQNVDANLNQLASTGMKLSRLPRTLAELIGSPGGKPYPGYDVVILYDPEPTLKGFDGTFVKMLQQYVQKHNGGLCYIVGNKHSDSVLRSGGDYKPLAEMLPVVLAGNTDSVTERIARRRPDPWPVRLTSYGVDHPVTRLGRDADETQAVWRVLPGIYWSHPIHKAKISARVLAVSSDPTRRTRADNRPEPLVAVQRYGSGRVGFLGFDASWRWIYLKDGYYHNRFWANMVRYLASLKARQVVITTGGDRFAAGERITLEVEAYDEKFVPWKADTFEVRMVDVASGESTTIKLKAVKGADGKNIDGQFKATIPTRRTGTFELTALAGDPQAAGKVAGKTITIELPKAEAARSEADEATMKTVASRPENFLTIDQIDKLVEVIPAGTKIAVEEKPRELWDSNLALVLVVVLLATEWILRKRCNMA